MRTSELSRKRPTRDIGARTVEIEAGLPKDRLKGYVDNDDATVGPDDLKTKISGADARAALVGAYKKRNKKGFSEKSGGSSRGY